MKMASLCQLERIKTFIAVFIIMVIYKKLFNIFKLIEKSISFFYI